MSQAFDFIKKHFKNDLCIRGYKYNKVWVIFEKLLQTYVRNFGHGKTRFYLQGGRDYYIDGQNTQRIFFEKMTTGGGKKAPQFTPRCGPWSFIILKKSHQDLSNEGSNFILSSLEVGHWVAQT